jgi:light-regulated signal transduction histidine kinase (bacteriophytochrome)
LTVEQVKGQARQLAALNQELATTNKEPDAFIYAVSHDLRRPLRGISGFSHGLLRDYSDRLDEKGQQRLAGMMEVAENMGQMIDGLLDLSRLTRRVPRWEPVDLTVQVQAIAADLQQQEPGRQVEFIIVEQVMAQGDARLLRVALTNLLSNAWKFTGQRRQARIEFGATRGDEGTIFYVRDNGAGFDMAYADKLFGAFQRLHSSSEFPGTGIGLATVQRIIHRHGGRIWAESRVKGLPSILL